MKQLLENSNIMEEYTYSDFLEDLELEDFDDVTLSVVYTNRDGETHKFQITDISESLQYGEKYIDAYCVDRDGEYEGIERTFKLERIEDAVVV